MLISFFFCLFEKVEEEISFFQTLTCAATAIFPFEKHIWDWKVFFCSTAYIHTVNSPSLGKPKYMRARCIQNS